MSEKSKKITAVIPALNEQDKIGKCLESLTWCDMIIVVDSGSIDKTAEIASYYADLLIRGEGLLCSEAIYIGLDFVNTDWVIELDADEKITDRLKKEIIDNIKNNTADGFIAPRKNIVWNRVMEINYALRIFNRKKASINFVRQHPQSNIKINGKVKRLKGCIEHYMFYDIESQISKLNRYSTNQVKDRTEKKEKFKLLNVFIRPSKVFMYHYFRCGCIKTGLLGLFRASSIAFFRFVEEIKLWELYQKEKMNKKNK